MEQAQDPTARAPAQGVSPVKAAIVLLLVVALALTAWSLTGRGNDTTPTQAPAAQPPAVPSEQEIIAEFERLDALRHQASENVDPSLISKIAYPGSPFEEEFSSDLRVLLRHDVVPRVRYLRSEVTVEALTAERASLLQEATVRIRFYDAAGREVTIGKRPIQETNRWTLAKTADGTWLIYRIFVIKSRRVQGRGS